MDQFPEYKILCGAPCRYAEASPTFDILPLTPGGPWSHTFGLDQVLLCPISNPTLGQSSPQVPERWVAPMSEQH